MQGAGLVPLPSYRPSGLHRMLIARALLLFALAARLDVLVGQPLLLGVVAVPAGDLDESV